MTKNKTNVDIWLERETEHKRKALENASRYFDGKDTFTVNTLEAIYGQESSFGTQLRNRGIEGAAGEFHLDKVTAREYGLIVSKTNDQRFDIDYASIAAARYLKDLDRSFSKRTVLSKDTVTSPINDSLERKKFVLAAYNGGGRRIADAQYFAQQAGSDPSQWSEVQSFLEKANFSPNKIKEVRQYVESVPENEIKFADKSQADKRAKNKPINKRKNPCTDGHWITKDDHHIFICD